jgi:hypothetical protein
MRIACIMMQKNEDDLLETWIAYHANLFGFKNLFIFDNGSNSEVINSIYQKYIPLGISVHQSFEKKSFFYRKGDVLGNYIKFLDNTDEYDFFIPLDCDEYIAVRKESGDIGCDGASIELELQKYRDTEHPLSITGSYFNIPKRDGAYYFYPELKLFFGAKTFEFMDEGFHVGRTRLSHTPVQTNIVHFHYSNKPYELGQLHAKEKLSELVNDFSVANMINYNGGGGHLKRFFIQSKEEYENTPIQNEVILPNFKIKLDELGLKIPFSNCSAPLSAVAPVTSKPVKPLESGCFFWSNGERYKL